MQIRPYIRQYVRVKLKKEVKLFMDKIHMELEEVETQAEQLESFLLMLEQSLIYNNFGGEIFLPAVSHMANISDEMTKRIKELKAKYTPKTDEVVQA